MRLLESSESHVREVNSYIPAAEALARARVLERAKLEEPRAMNVRGVFNRLVLGGTYSREFIRAMDEILIARGLRVKWPRGDA